MLKEREQTNYTEYQKAQIKALLKMPVNAVNDIMSKVKRGIIMGYDMSMFLDFVIDSDDLLKLGFLEHSHTDDACDKCEENTCIGCDALCEDDTEFYDDEAAEFVLNMLLNFNIDLRPYVGDFDIDQLNSICTGVIKGYDPELFAKEEYSESMISTIIEAIGSGLDVSKIDLENMDNAFELSQYIKAHQLGMDLEKLKGLKGIYLAVDVAKAEDAKLQEFVNTLSI